VGNFNNKEDFLFNQVYDYVANRIDRNEWKEHEKLPSIRQLAQELNIHRLTVLKGYQLLKNDNRIYVKDKVGYFVESKGKGIIDDYSETPPFFHINSLSDIQQTPVEYNFSQALIDPNLLPNQYLSDYVKKVFDLYPKVLATYSHVQGDEELRETLTSYFIQQYKAFLHPNQLIILSGSQQGIHLISQTFIKPRDTVLLEKPSYSAAIDIFKSRGARIITVDITPDGYDLNQIEQYMRTYKPRLFYLNPTFHNPTGYTIPTDQRKELVQLAEQYQCLLVEDDPYHDIYFDMKPPQPVYTFDASSNVIYLRSFCKYISPGLRVAVMICPTTLIDSLISVKALTDNGAPLLNQKIFLHYFLSPRLQQHLDKLRIALQIRKEIMERELAHSDWHWNSPHGGLNLWIKVPEYLSTEPLLYQTLMNSISFVPGSFFDPDKNLPAWMRLSYSYTNEANLQKGMRKLIQSISSTNR
jgi:GntR family transcriptional regulator, regulator for abcA and norABC